MAEDQTTLLLEVIEQVRLEHPEIALPIVAKLRSEALLLQEEFDALRACPDEVKASHTALRFKELLSRVAHLVGKPYNLR